MNSKKYSASIMNDILKYKNMKARNSSNLLEQQKIDEKALRYKRKKSPLEIPNIAKKKTFTYKQNSNQNDGDEVKKEKFSPFRPSVYEPMKQTKIPMAQFETQKSKPIRKKQKNADDTEESASFVQSDILDSKKTETETLSQAQNEISSKGPAKKHPLVHQKMKLPGNYDKGLENLNKLQQDMIKAQNEAKNKHAQKGNDKLKENAYMKDEIESKHETPRRERRMTIEGLHNYAKNEISKVNAAFKRVGIPRKNLMRRPGSADNEAKSNLLLKNKKHSQDYLADADVNKKIMRSPPSPKRLGDDNLLDDKLFNERLENYGKKSPKSMFPPPKVSPKSFPKESPKQKRHRGDRGKEKSSEKGSPKTSSASDSKSKKQKEADRYHERDDKDKSPQQHHPQFSGETQDSYEDATYNMRKHKGRHIPDFFRLFHASVIENKQDSFDGRDYGNIDFRLLKLGFSDSDDDYYIDEFGNRVLKPGRGKGDPNQGGGRDGTDGDGNADGENYDYYLNVLRDGGTLDDDDPNLNPSAKLLLTEFESPYPDLGTGNTLSSSGLSHDKGRGLGFDDMDGAFGGKKKRGLFDDSDDDGKGGKGRGKWGKGNRLGGLGFSDTYSSDSLNANKKKRKGDNDMDDDDDLNSESNLYGGKKYQRKAYETGILDIKGKKAFAWENYINNLLQVGKLERKSSREQWFRFELPMDMKLLETMSTEEYLRDFCFLTRDREIVYERPYTKFQTNPKDGKPYLSKEKLFEAVQDVMIESLTEEQIEELQSMFELGDNISRVYFNGICAVAQRLYFRKNLGSFTFEAILCQRSFLEKADFHALESKLKGVKVKTPLDKLINAINMASIEQEDESEMRDLHKVDRRFVVKRPSFHDMFSAMLSN